MIEILVVDDSAFMRRAIARMLEREADFHVCGSASSGAEAVELARTLRPDVITMDVEMPGMDGLEAVRAIVAHDRIPIIMVSSLTRQGAETTLRALELGALDFIAKPDAAFVDILMVAKDLVAKVRVLARRARSVESPVASPPSAAPPAQPRGRFECVIIGTSTGGPIALSKVVPAIPREFPIPIVIIQHMPAGFTRPLAERLATQSKIAVSEAVDGMALVPGHAVVAPAGRQFGVRRAARSFTVALSDDNGSSLHVPSVDRAAASVGEACGSGALGVILTGMGSDGVIGLRELKARGGYVIGQDEASCVVYGMPRAAAAAGLVDRVVPLSDLAKTLCEITNTKFTVT